MVRKTAVEKSEHRDEIDDFLLKGESARFVSKYIYDKYNEKISHQAITRYRKKCLNVEDQVRIEYQDKKSKEKVHVEVSKGVTDLEKLDKIIDKPCDTTPDLNSVEDPTEREKLKIQIDKGKVQAIKTKHDILKDETITVDINTPLSNLGEMIGKGVEDYKKKE